MWLAEPARGELPPPSAPATFDAATLREGRFTYRLTIDGKPGGQFVLTVRRQADDSYRFTGDAIGFNQRWEAVTTRSFEPLSALLTLTRHGQPYRMNLAYAKETVSVTQTLGDTTESSSAALRENPAATLPTVDQRIDWAGVMASKLELGQQVEFQVFDAATGISRVRVAMESAPAMESPLGRHEAVQITYQITKAGSTEKYVVFATREAPRLMLRETLRENEVSELEKVEP